MPSPRETSGMIHEFSLAASTGQTLGLDSFLGKVPMVIVFVDLSTAEGRALLAEMDSRLRDFGSERSQALVVVRETARETRRLSDEMGLSIPVLADASGAMARDFDVEEDDGSYRRVAIVADKEGRLMRRFDPLPAEEESSELVDALIYAIRAIGTGALETPD